MLAVPLEIPVTWPNAGAIVATAALLVLHVPPVVELVKVVMPPGHMVNVPAIAGGGAPTVMLNVL